MLKWIKDIYNFKKLQSELFKVYEEENLIERFSELYNVNFKVDKVGRIYAVVNPFLQNIKDNNTSQIYEYTSEGMSDVTYIKQWVFTKLMAIEKMFAAENLLDTLLFDIKQIKANDKPSGNYLITFTPFGFDDYVNAKKNLIITGLVALLAVILIILGMKIFI